MCVPTIPGRRLELEREKGRQRIYDAMVRLAKAGRVTGGLVFGYDNVTVLGADGKPSHVERRINEAQAAIVREIFDRYASGWGYAHIAKDLNARHPSNPRPTEHKPAGWSPSSVPNILRRDLYRGIVVWNQSRKRDTWGRQHQTARPRRNGSRSPSTSPPHCLRRAVGRGARAVYSHTDHAGDCAGTPAHRAARHRLALSALGTCALRRLRVGNDDRHPSFWDRAASTACAVPHVPVEPQTRSGGVPERAAGAPGDGRPGRPRGVGVGGARFPPHLDHHRSGLRPTRPEQPETTLGALDRELRALDGKIAHLMAAVERGGALDPLIAQLRARQQDRERLLAAIASARTVDRLHLDRAAIEATVQAQVAHWRASLTGSIDDGRTLLREVLSEPLVFTPEEKGYHFRGRVATGELIAAAVNGGCIGGVPTGCTKGGRSAH